MGSRRSRVALTCLFTRIALTVFGGAALGQAFEPEAMGPLAVHPENPW